MLAPDRWLRVRSLLEEVIDRPEGERRAYLAEACREAPDVRVEVESLLRAHSDAGSFLEPPEAPPTEPAIDEPAAALLPAGTRLGPFELTALLGTGGMGQVYRALDTRLNRQVALKVLSPTLAAQARSRGWLEHEGRSISQLTHPHICVLHDVGVATLDDGSERGFLVMELVEGETLAARLARGAIPAGEAVIHATQIAEALAAAHTRGIVHGDVKPSNIVLSRTGVKLLDFGLARLRPPASRGASRLDTPAHSPIAGIAGTLPYIAPEVLQGREADERSDIHAFGVVLYEMLSGQRPYAAPSAPELVAMIVDGTPRSLPDTLAVPPALARIVTTCLAKEPADRWQHAHDLALALRTLGEQVGGVDDAAKARARRTAATAWRAAVIVLSIAGGVLLVRGFPAATPRAGVPHRLMFDADPVRAGEVWSPAISPDGRTVAFLSGREGGSEFYLRHLDTGETKSLAKQVDMGCSWSGAWTPDGRTYLYATTSHVMAVNAADGSTRALVRIAEPAAALHRGVSMNDRGTILIGGGRLLHASGEGEQPEPLYRRDPSVTLQVYPSFLPNGRDFVFTQAATDPAEQGIFLGTLGSDHVVRLLPDFSNASVSVSGHLLFGRAGSVLAKTFDSRHRTISGSPGVLVSGVLTSGGYTHFAQRSGHALVYVPHTAALSGELVWYDRVGSAAGALGRGIDYRQIALSPDARRVVAERPGYIAEATGSSLMILDLAHGTTRGANVMMGELEGMAFGGDVDPVWAPDGRRVAFTAWVNEDADLFVTDIDSTDPPRRLAHLPGMQWAEQWSADNRFLLYVHTESATKNSLWALPVEGGAAPMLLVDTPFSNDEPQLSPDGRWLAYESNESGDVEVYVQPFPTRGERLRLSTGGGRQPKWRGDGRELFYLTPEGTMTVVAFGPAGVRGRPQPLFSVPLRPDRGIDQFAVTADGQRFLLISMPTPTESARVAVVSNWPALLDD